MKKLLCLFLLLFTMAACTHRPPKLVIGVSQCSQDIWRDKLNRELKSSEYFNDSIEVKLASANDDSEKQKQQIRQFVADGVDLLIVAPNQYASITPAIEEAYEKGIPVILYDRKVNSKKYSAFIGGDNYTMGKLMGRYIARRLGGEGRVVEIRGLEGSSPAADRHRGFCDGIADFPGIRLVASEAGNWKEESGAEAMRRIMKQTAEFDYVFGQNDRMALGAYRVLQASGRAEGVLFSGIDALHGKNGGLELVRDGIFDASYLYPTKGHEVIALALNILHRRPYRHDNLLSTTIVTRDNAELLLMQAKDMEAQNDNLDLLHQKVDTYFNQYSMQRSFIAMLAVMLLVITVAAVMTYRAYLSKSRLSIQLRQSNNEQRRLTEEVRTMTQGQLQFFTNVSHELRTPLTLIADPVDRLLESGELKDDSRKTMKIVRRNVQVLMRLVDEILDFRKVQNGKMSLTVSRFDLKEALTRWMDAFADSAEGRHISLDLQLPDSMPDGCTITADFKKVGQAYTNLMSNALKYTPAGGSIVTRLEATGDRYVIKVSDTGAGIAPEDQPNIFGRFYQGQSATGGTGIGLALVKAYTELHGGEVSVESLPGKGTCFTISLPATPPGLQPQTTSDEGETAQTGLQTPVATAYGKNQPLNTEQHLDDVVEAEHIEKPEVLIVDDNSDVREYLRTILKDLYHVTEASDGQTALSMARKMVPDLVVCDVMMPVMDGLAFTRLLKEDTTTSHIPVILLTARSLDDQMAEGYDLGADSYITKPFSSKVLLSRIRNLMDNRERLRQLYNLSMKPDDTAVAASRPADKTQAMSDRDQMFIDKLRQIVQQHLGDSDLSVERIGEEIGLSRVQLYRKVKALTGLSPVEILRKARLQRGKKLLETTDMSISEIAYDVGFTSPSYFTKCFKDEFQIGPSDINR